jgi:crotonobetainyl-CoA:carnitine CoA-transferase CaiB-like acyl-CoA transferase
MHASLNVTTEGSTYNYLVAGEVLQRQTGRHASIKATPQSQMLCKDGIYINLGFPARTKEQWLHLLNWLEEEGLLEDLGDHLSIPNWEAMRRGDPAAIEQQKTVMKTVGKLAGKLDAYDMFQKAQSLGFQWGIIYSPEEVLEDPHFKARGFPVEVDHPETGESYIYPGAPYKLPESPWNIQGRAPLLGEHNEEIYLSALNLTKESYIQYKELQVI